MTDHHIVHKATAGRHYWRCTCNRGGITWDEPQAKHDAAQHLADTDDHVGHTVRVITMMPVEEADRG